MTICTRRHFMIGALLSPIATAGCGGSSSLGRVPTPRSAVFAWTSTLLDAISATHFGPPIVSRAIGIVSTAMYDAWACYDTRALGTRLGGQLRRPAAEHTLQNKQQAISAAAYRALADLFPTEKARFDSHMQALVYDPTDTSMDVTHPQGIGNRVAQALLDFRHNDGSNQLNGYADTTGYVPINTPDNVVDPSKWQPLRFANGQSPAFIAPHWGNVVPFGLTSPSAVRPTSPPAYGSPSYLAQVQAIIDLTANLNDERKAIAEYWADGPKSVLPPGHWQLLAIIAQPPKM